MSFISKWTGKWGLRGSAEIDWLVKEGNQWVVTEIKSSLGALKKQEFVAWMQRVRDSCSVPVWVVLLNSNWSLPCQKAQCPDGSTRSSPSGTFLMKRVPLLNDSQSGFHARSRLLKASIARLVMESLQSKKGYIDPVLDVGIDVYVFERPVECLNMRTPDEEQPYDPQRGYSSRGPTEALLPYQPHGENWPWEKAIALCDEESSIRWRFFPELSCYRKEKLSGRTVEIGWQSFFCPRRNTGQWYFWLGWRPHQDTPAGRDLTGRIGRALEGILRISGLHRWIEPRWNENTGDWAVDILALEEDLPEDQPRLGLVDIGSESDFRRIVGWEIPGLE